MPVVEHPEGGAHDAACLDGRLGSIVDERGRAAGDVEDTYDIVDGEGGDKEAGVREGAAWGGWGGGELARKGFVGSRTCQHGDETLHVLRGEKCPNERALCRRDAGQICKRALAVLMSGWDWEKGGCGVFCTDQRRRVGDDKDGFAAVHVPDTHRLVERRGADEAALLASAAEAGVIRNGIMEHHHGDAGVIIKEMMMTMLASSSWKCWRHQSSDLQRPKFNVLITAGLTGYILISSNARRKASDLPRDTCHGVYKCVRAWPKCREGYG